MGARVLIKGNWYKPDRRRALELLAASRDGATEAIMLAHGFTVPLIVELVCVWRAFLLAN